MWHTKETGPYPEADVWESKPYTVVYLAQCKSIYFDINMTLKANFIFQVCYFDKEVKLKYQSSVLISIHERREKNKLSHW